MRLSFGNCQEYRTSNEDLCCPHGSLFGSPNSVVNTWGSYGSGKRPGGQIEVADGIRRYFHGFVPAFSFCL